MSTLQKMMLLVLGVTFFIGMSTTALMAAEMKEDVNKSGLEKMKSVSSKKMEMKSAEKYDENKKPLPKKSVKCGAGKCGDTK